MGNPDIMVFIGNIKAAGVGITLTASRTLIFNDFDYVPGNNNQMSDRIHRLTQTRPVHIIYQIFRNTQYQKMWEINVKKQVTIDTVIKKEEEKR
jgi:SWI/SNF-related matrix-associated actin-dependent regulator 1 of chromatin subfamily A